MLFRSDVAAAMTGVQTGLYDGFVIDLPVSSNLIAKSFTDLKVAEKIPTGEQYGIAVSKDNPGLTAAINDALAKIKSDGTMDYDTDENRGPGQSDQTTPRGGQQGQTGENQPTAPSPAQPTGEQRAADLVDSLV